MKELTMYQYSVVSGEKAILEATISGNATVQAGLPMEKKGPHTWECTVGADNIVFVVLATFPDLTPGSRVDLTIDGEIKGVRGDGPFAVDPILPVSGVKDPEFQLFVKK